MLEPKPDPNTTLKPLSCSSFTHPHILIWQFFSLCPTPTTWPLISIAHWLAVRRPPGLQSPMYLHLGPPCLQSPTPAHPDATCPLIQGKKKKNQIFLVYFTYYLESVATWLRLRCIERIRFCYFDVSFIFMFNFYWNWVKNLGFNWLL